MPRSQRGTRAGRSTAPPAAIFTAAPFSASVPLSVGGRWRTYEFAAPALPAHLGGMKGPRVMPAQVGARLGIGTVFILTGPGPNGAVTLGNGPVAALPTGCGCGGAVCA